MQQDQSQYNNYSFSYYNIPMSTADLSNNQYNSVISSPNDSISNYQSYSPANNSANLGYSWSNYNNYPNYDYNNYQNYYYNSNNSESSSNFSFCNSVNDYNSNHSNESSYMQSTQSNYITPKSFPVQVNIFYNFIFFDMI